MKEEVATICPPHDDMAAFVSLPVFPFLRALLVRSVGVLSARVCRATCPPAAAALGARTSTADGRLDRTSKSI
nr:hypothetical protein [Burkholderia pseudomallei]